MGGRQPEGGYTPRDTNTTKNMIKLAKTDKSIDQIKLINQINTAARGVRQLTAAGRQVVGTIPAIDGFGVVYQVIDGRGHITLLTDQDLQNNQIN